jgi:hypothetical protein
MLSIGSGLTSLNLGRQLVPGELPIFETIIALLSEGGNKDLVVTDTDASFLSLVKTHLDFLDVHKTAVFVVSQVQGLKLRKMTLS